MYEPAIKLRHRRPANSGHYARKRSNLLGQGLQATPHDFGPKGSVLGSRILVGHTDIG